MKNNILLLGVGALLCFGAVSCEEYENSATPSQITYLPLIEVAGEESVMLDCNATGFTDPGATASEGGSPIDVETTVNGLYFGSTTIDQPDLYQITYSATNQDGIPGAMSREVMWPACNGDLITSIEGMYQASVKRTASTGAVNSDYIDADFTPFWIVDLGDNTYGISDAIGGFYEDGYGYGPDYAATGLVVKANSIPGNDFEVVASNGVGAFGGAIEISDFTVNPATKTITFTTTWDAGYVFEVELNQVD